jgi:GT2 family glycosyltransferase
VSAPQVSVFLWHQCDNNAPYLDLCVKSLLRQKSDPDFSFEVICVAGTKERPKLPPEFTLIHDPSRVSVASKFDLAMAYASVDSTHTLLLSDDIICSETMIYDLYASYRGRGDAIINPMSNSDCQSLYDADLWIEKPRTPAYEIPKMRQLTPDMTIEDFQEWEIEALMTYPRRRHLLVPFVTLSFFCTMIPKSTWLKLGGLDPALEHRHNDQDFCMRAHMQGIPKMVQFGTFAFHFGSRTIRQLATPESQTNATDHFKRKWGL